MIKLKEYYEDENEKEYFSYYDDIEMERGYCMTTAMLVITMPEYIKKLALDNNVDINDDKALTNLLDEEPLFSLTEKMLYDMDVISCEKTYMYFYGIDIEEDKCKLTKNALTLKVTGITGSCEYYYEGDEFVVENYDIEFSWDYFMHHNNTTNKELILKYIPEEMSKYVTDITLDIDYDDTIFYDADYNRIS
jgi:hypothetical protein